MDVYISAPYSRELAELRKRQSEEAIVTLRNALPHGRKSINKTIRRLQRRFEGTLQIIAKEVKNKFHVFFGDPNTDSAYGAMVIAMSPSHYRCIGKRPYGRPRRRGRV